MLCCAVLRFDATNAHLTGVKATTVVRADGQGEAAQHKKAGRQHSTAQHSTAQHSTAQHSTAQHSTAHRIVSKHSAAQQPV